MVWFSWISSVLLPPHPSLSYTHIHTHTQIHPDLHIPVSTYAHTHTLIHLSLTHLPATQHSPSAELLRPLLRHVLVSSSVHHSEGTKCPPCIMYVLIELIETENVMLHSGELLIGWLLVTRLVRRLQSQAASPGGVGKGVSGCVLILGVWGQLRTVQQYWLTNYSWLFWLWLYVLQRMREQSPGRSNKIHCWVCSTHQKTPSPKYKMCQERSTKRASLWLLHMSFTMVLRNSVLKWRNKLFFSF